MRPMNLGETLDASITVVRRSWRTLAAVMIVVALPIQVLDVVIVSATTDSYEVGSAALSTGGSGSGTTYGDEGAYVAGQVLTMVLSVVGYLLGTVACYRAIVDSHLGVSTSAEASLRFAGRRLSAALWLGILLFLALVGAFLAFIIPGIWLAVAWSVAFPVMLVEGRLGTAALGRSFALVKGHWWATFGRLAVAYILVSVVTAVATLLLVAPAVAIIDDTSFAALVLEHVADFLVSLATTPFIAAVTTFVYFDLRARKEGFDPAQLAPRPPEPAEPPPPAPPPTRWEPPVAPEPRRPPQP
jgi:hypothetical protein